MALKFHQMCLMSKAIICPFRKTLSETACGMIGNSNKHLIFTDGCAVKLIGLKWHSFKARRMIPWGNGPRLFQLVLGHQDFCREERLPDPLATPFGSLVTELAVRWRWLDLSGMDVVEEAPQYRVLADFFYQGRHPLITRSRMKKSKQYSACLKKRLCITFLPVFVV